MGVLLIRRGDAYLSRNWWINGVAVGSPKILFRGRDFEMKNGHLASRIFRGLLKNWNNVQITLIGPIPDECLVEFSDVISVRSSVSHQFFTAP